MKVGEPGYSYRLRARAVEVKVEAEIDLYASMLHQVQKSVALFGATQKISYRNFDRPVR